MIPQRNISLLSNRLAKAGGRRIPEAVLERDYCLAWYLVGLSRSPLRNCLAFKGGTALKRCYFGDYRFSEDLDFTLTTPASLEEILVQEITGKLEFRGRRLEDMGDFGKKEARLKKLWQMRLANQMAELPHFEEVYRAVQRAFRGAGLIGERGLRNR